MASPDILLAETATDLYDTWEVLREEHPLYFHEGMQAYTVSRYEDVEKVFKDRRFTTENYSWQLEPVHGRTILQLDGREHSVQRGLVAPAFRGKELTEKFMPVIEKKSRELIDTFRHDGEVDLVEQYTAWFPINVIVDMLALPKADQELFRRWYTWILGYAGNLAQDPEVTKRGVTAKEELQEYMLPKIAERRANPRDDLLSTLCTAEIDGQRMTDLEIKAFVSLLLAAGGETTDKAVASMMLNLLENPEQMALVRKDRSLISHALAETLRHSPPVLVIFRQPSEDIEMTGGTIPAGATVAALIGAANRDPRKYSHPERFDITRPDLNFATAFAAAANHTGFAFGRHFCVGAMLAKAEVETAGNQLLDAMDDIELVEPAEVHGVFLRAPTRMKLRFTPTS